MADEKVRDRSENENEALQENEVTELDDKNLEGASGGVVVNNCNC